MAKKKKPTFQIYSCRCCLNGFGTFFTWLRRRSHDRE